MSLIDKAFGITKSEPFKTQYLTPLRMKKLYFVLYQLYPYAFNKCFIFLHHAHKYFWYNNFFGCKRANKYIKLRT